MVALTALPDGQGYWLLTAGGQVYAFGAARSYASRVPGRPSAPAVGMAATADGRGYWVVDADGTVWSFGATLSPGRGCRRPPAPSWGSPPMPPPVGTGWSTPMAPFTPLTPRSSVPSRPPRPRPPSPGIQAGPGGAGYRLVDGGGALFCFGTATQLGSAGTGSPGPCRGRDRRTMTGHYEVGSGGANLAVPYVQ